jgi:LysM repeat protein
LRALFLLAFVAATAHAQSNTTMPYRVKPKDTVEIIAAEQYGDRGHAVFIIAENKLKNGRVLPYTRIKIPITREITTDKGDTFESLAQTYLGDPRRAPILAEYNELDVSDTPATGTALTIPFHVTHVAQGNESLNQVAAQLLDDSKQGELIRKYNFLDKNGLEKGESVLVPVLSVRMRQKPAVDAQAKQRRDQHRKAMGDAEATLPAARAAWLQADFAEVKTLLAPFNEQMDYLDTKMVVQIGLLLGRAHVAFGEAAPATAAFTQVLDRKPSHRLTPYGDSPKVIEAWKQAGGQLVE